MDSPAYFRRLINSQELILYLCVLGFFIYPISNSIGQVPIYIASIQWIRLAFQKKLPFLREDLFWLMGFSLIAGVSLIYSVRPELGIEKWNRILLFGLPLGLPFLGLERGNFNRVIAFVGGGICLGGVSLFIFDSIRIPIEMGAGIAFLDTNDMTSPQFYMVALILFLGLVLEKDVLPLPTWLVVLVIIALVGGMILHNKRGVWIAAVLGLMLFFLVRRNWKAITVVCVLVASIALTPPVKNRLNDLRSIFDVARGDRVVLWKDVAPKICREYPYGMGLNASMNSDFQKYTENYLQKSQRHLHNNILQIQLELGWHGLLFWLAWMGRVLYRLGRGLMTARQGTEVSPAGLAILCSLVALLVNGMVEYNFGDSEIFTLFLVLIGLSGIFSKPVLQAAMESR